MKRDAQMLAMREEGMTYEAIGKEFGLSRQRVHQIVQREVMQDVLALARKLRSLDKI